MDNRAINQLRIGDFVRLSDKELLKVTNIQYIRNKPRWFMLIPLLPTGTSYKCNISTLHSAELAYESDSDVQAALVLYGQKST